MCKTFVKKIARQAKKLGFQPAAGEKKWGFSPLQAIFFGKCGGNQPDLGGINFSHGELAFGWKTMGELTFQKINLWGISANYLS